MIEQIMIALTGLVAVGLSQQSNLELRRYACLFGLAGQPFWFYATLQADQFGIFVLSLFYTYAWGMGLYNDWIKAQPSPEGFN